MIRWRYYKQYKIKINKEINWYKWKWKNKLAKKKILKVIYDMNRWIEMTIEIKMKKINQM